MKTPKKVLQQLSDSSFSEGQTISDWLDYDGNDLPEEERKGLAHVGYLAAIAL